MANLIACPKCGAEFEVTEALSAQLRSELRAELEADARRKAEEDLTVDLKERDDRFKEVQGKLKKAQQNELALRKRERDLQSQQEQLELEVARKIDKERESIRKAAMKQAAEDRQFKDAEKDKVIGDLRKQIDEMKLKAEQGSQQTQGEVLELALEEMLRSRYPADSIEEVAKGVGGADVVQKVKTDGGVDCGTIIWESKRTKNWNKTWLPKLRQDQRNAKAFASVLVSSALPEGVNDADQIDGIWVCAWTCAPIIADLLRVGMMETAVARRASQGQQGKMELVYNYLSGAEFRNRLTGVVEALSTMRAQLESEKRAIQAQWAKREKQIEQAGMGAAGIYGDFQGIIGSSLAEIEGMEFHQLEAKD